MAELDKYTKKAIEDPEFRKRVLEDANKAIKEEFGDEPPYKVTYHITDPKNIVFTFPPITGELDDLELESAAGGKSSEQNNQQNSKPNWGPSAYACFPDLHL